MSNSPLKGIGLMIGAMFCFALMSNLIQLLAHTLPTGQIVLLRNVVSFLLLLPWVAGNGLKVLKTERISGHFWRAAIGIVAMECWFYSLSIMPINRATALSFTTPIFVTLFAMIIFKEHAGLKRWLAIAIGFAGTLVILRPGAETLEFTSLFVLAASSLMATTSLLVRSLTKTEAPELIVLYMAFFMIPFSLPMAWFDWRAFGWFEMVLVVGIAASSTLAHLFLSKSYTMASMATLMPFDFTRLIFASAIAYVLFGETLDGMTSLGAAMIVASSAWIAHLESRKPKRLDALEEMV